MSCALCMILCLSRFVQDFLFFLLQSELGDLYKVTIDFQGNQVSDLKVKYFDTIAPCSSLCLTKTGLLYAASEFANQ